MRQSVKAIRVLLISLATATPVAAQSTLELDRVGAQPNRDYLGLQPFERLDTQSGNISLTMTDLTLPGNAGHDLRFQLTYNGNTQGNQWTFGIPGLPMRIRQEQSWPTGPIVNTLEGTRTITPILEMADGGERRTVFEQVNPDWGDIDHASTRVVQTSGFWRYDRLTHTLSLTDGTVCTYEPIDPQNPGNGILRLKEIEDVFGNVVTLTWSAGSLDVQQILVNESARDVHFDMNALTGLPTSMRFDDRQWDYEYEQVTSDRLAHIRPPGGHAGWTFTYDTPPGRLGEVTTPWGGRIEYHYEPEVLQTPSGAVSRMLLKWRKTFGPGSQDPLGQWDIVCNWAVGSTYCSWTTVATPSANLTYTYGTINVPHPETLIDGSIGLQQIDVIDRATNTTLEHQYRTYTELPVIANYYRSAEISVRRINRAGRNYLTTYTYDSDPIQAGFHCPTQISETGETETGEVSHNTVRAYTHYQVQPRITCLLVMEAVVEGAQTARRDFEYDNGNVNDRKGFLTQATEAGVYPYNLQMSFSGDDGGNIETVTRRGLTTSFTYTRGQQATITNPLTTVSRVVNLDGAIDRETRDGRTTTFEYDPASGLLQTVRPPGNNRSPITFAPQYDANGFWTGTQTTRGNSTTTTTIDGFGQPIGTENNAVPSVKARIGYDAEGRVVYQGYPFTGTAANDRGTTATFDGLGRVTRLTNPGSTFQTRAYGPGTVTVTDENDHQTVQTWQAFGDPDRPRLTALRDADHKDWAYEYDVLGQLRKITAPDQLQRTWVYNEKNLLISETHPESGTTTYGYDDFGRLSQKTDANNIATTYTYDANNRIEKITAGSRVTTISYEAGSDNRLSTSTGSVGTTFLYDDASRLRLRQDAIDGKLFNSQYEYYGDDSLKAILYPSGRRIDYEYNNQHQITKVSEIAAGRDYALGMLYHPSGAIATWTASNNISPTLTYDPQRYWPASITAGPLQLTYQNYDGAGNVGTITNSHFGNQTFTYDVLDRLSTATAPSSYGSIAYAYDAHGNRQTNSNGSYQYQSETLRLIQQDTIPFTYYNNGNLHTAGPATYTYTPNNMLETATVVGGTVTYMYDGDDWRVKRTAGGSTSYYLRGLNGQLLEEWKDPGTPTGLIRDYIYAGSRLLSRVDKSTTVDPNNTCGVIVIGGAPVPVSAIADQNPCLKFDGTTGQRVSIVVTNNSISTSWLSILSPSQTPLFGGILYGLPFGSPSSFIDPQTLDAPGTSTLAIDPWWANTGSVTLALINVPPDAIVPITPDGLPKTVTTTVPGQNGRLTFAGTAGQRVSALWFGDTVPYGSFSLLKPDGSSLFSTLLWGGSYGFMEPQTLPETGTYTLLIDPNGTNTGSARAWLYEVPPDVMTPITPGGSPVTVTLTAPGQSARLTFSGTAGQRVAVTSSNNTIGVSFFALAPPEGWYLFYGDMYGGQNGFMDTKTLPVTGTYTLVVDPSWTNTGSVTLTLYDVPPDVTGSIAADSVPVSVTTSSLGQNARLTFNGTAGQRVSVTSTNNTINLSTFSLIKPDGWNLFSGNMWAGGNGFMDVQTLPVTGTYSLFVDPWWGYTGSVTLTLYEVTDQAASLTIDGSPATLPLTTPGQNGTVTFAGSAGQQATVHVTGNTIGWTGVTLRKPDGGALTSVWWLDSSFNLQTQTLPTTGTYTIEVDPTWAGTGNITISVTSP
jgi:YD repeat-containing protein